MGRRISRSNLSPSDGKGLNQEKRISWMELTVELRPEVLY